MKPLIAIPVSAAIVWGLTACCCVPRMPGPPVVVNLPPPPPIQVQEPPPPPKVAPKPAPPKTVPGKKSIDLIALINPAVDAVENRRWEIKGGELHCLDGSFVPRIQIPYEPPAEYDFTVVYSQPNLRNGIAMIMPNPNGGSFFWFLGPNNSLYGFHSEPNIEGSIANLIQPNTAVTTTVQVRKNNVKGIVNGKEMISHPTTYKELTGDDWRNIPNKKLLALACDDPTVFHYVRVVEITGKGTKIR